MLIKEQLASMLRGGEKNPCKVATYSKNIALAYLKKKVSSGNHYILRLTNSLEDLAWDCIADLFERSDENRYVQFENYFSSLQMNELSEAEAQIRLRRLVFSKVNDGLFRNLGIFDMSLSKIIRNLKLAASGADFAVDRKGSDNYIFFDNASEAQTEKPIMPPEFLEIKLTNRLNTTMDTPEVLDEVRNIFNSQQLYQNKYPVVQMAKVIRNSFVHLHDNEKKFTIYKDPLLRKEKLSEYLQQSLDHCKECFNETYVSKGKINQESFDNYISCIEKILHHHYITESEIGDSYYDHFNDCFSGVSKEEYRHEHRQYLEYMVKLVRKDLLQKLRKVI